MELFLNTANIDENRQAARLGVIRAITTNPSLAAKEGIGGFEAYKSAVKEISRIIDRPISVEVISTDVEGMITEGRDIADWIPNPWVKLPSTPVGLEAMAILTKDSIKVNQILCFSVNQAILGAQAGAHISTIPYKVLTQMIRHPLTEWVRLVFRRLAGRFIMSHDMLVDLGLATITTFYSRCGLFKIAGRTE